MAPSPTAATKEFGTAAVNFLELTKVVVSDIPFHFTMDVFTKLAPKTVRVTPVAPGCTLAGETISIYGTGFRGIARHEGQKTAARTANPSRERVTQVERERQRRDSNMGSGSS
jgi:hypothetical protein